MMLRILFILVGCSVACLALGDARVKNPPSVWVERADESRSCDEEKRSRSVEDDARILSQASIEIFSSQKAHDGNTGKMRAAVCGIPTGQLNRFLIPKRDLKRAKQLGFSEVSSVK